MQHDGLIVTPLIHLSQSILQYPSTFGRCTYDYWIATNRFDLSAEQIAQIYKLRWDIEKLFAWLKRHLKVYQLIARSPYGRMI